MKNAQMPAPTWKPHAAELKGRLSAAQRDALPATAFAFPHARKEPMTDAAHVRDAMARFDQVEDATDAERDRAFVNIQLAAGHYGILMKETEWRQFGVKHSGSRTST